MDRDDSVSSPPSEKDISNGDFRGQRRWSSAPPQVTYSEHPAGRETMAAIAEERRLPRPPESTQMYGDRISNAPGALSPQTARALDQKPEISVSIRPAGRETYTVIEQHLQDEAPEIAVEESARCPDDLDVAGLQIQELRTFLVRAPLKALEKPEARSRLVKARLLPHLPVQSMASVLSVDVRPWQEPGMLLVRVWCALP